MKLSILLRTSDHRGDHAADVLIAHEAIEGETVLQLAHRLLDGKASSAELEVIEIRRMRVEMAGG